MVQAYNIFIGRIKKDGSLIVNNKIRDKVKTIPGLKVYTYSVKEGSDFAVSGLNINNGNYCFDVETPDGKIADLIYNCPGLMNLENAVAAISIAHLTGVKSSEIRKALINFKGVARRFDIRVNVPGKIYIDDYAHHPEELNFLIESIREFYKDRKVTGIFQPHLFSRTRDNAEAFAESLDKFDRVILLPVYPAREDPIDGVDASLILNKMNLADRVLIEKTELLKRLEAIDIDILLTIGAGDIDSMVGPIEKMLNQSTE
jgi:UDP-N-acetylmuramate--alanine ligase